MADSSFFDPSLRLLGIIGSIAGILLVLWLERRPGTWHLGVAAFAALYGLIHLAVPGSIGSLYITLALTVATGLISKTKFRLLGFNLVAGDVLFLFANTFRVALKAYPGVILTVLLAVGILLGGTILLLDLLDETPTSLAWRFVTFLITWTAFAVTYVASGGRNRFRTQILTADRAHLSAFAASLLGAGPSHRPRFIDIDATPLALQPCEPGRLQPGERRPHIVMILHESTFDPRLFDLPGDPRFDAFFAPPGGMSGPLLVDVFGGGTWQTEFTVYSGLSSRSFGADGRFVFNHFAGRLRHALPGVLKSLGYRTRLLSADPKSFVNNERFYRSIGFEETEYPDTATGPFDMERWKENQHDAVVYDYALHRLKTDLLGDAPVFCSIMTLMNHGSHRRSPFPPELHADLRRQAIEASGDQAYGEYVVRLAESVRAYTDFRSALSELLAGQPALIVRFGDHQPSFTQPMTGLDISDDRLRTTFYAIEAINCSLRATVPPTLDLAFLSTLTLEAAGLPLDEISATRRRLMHACPGAYFDWQSPEKRQFHRTLMANGMVDLG